MRKTFIAIVALAFAAPAFALDPPALPARPPALPENTRVDIILHSNTVSQDAWTEQPAADPPRIDNKVTCPHCAGSGKHTIVGRNGIALIATCPNCAGTGKVDAPKVTSQAASSFTAPPGYALVPLTAGNGCSGGFGAGASCSGGFGGPQAGGCSGGFGAGAQLAGCAGGAGGGARLGLFAGRQSRVEHRIARREARRSGFSGGGGMEYAASDCGSAMSFVPQQQFAYAPQESSFVGAPIMSTPVAYYGGAQNCRMVNGRMVCN